MSVWTNAQRQQRSTNYNNADPNQRLIGFCGRFLRPALLGTVALALLGAGLIHGEPILTRLGFIAAVGSVLWVTALGFALGTLRLVAMVAAVVVVFALTRVGGNARNAADLVEYRSLRSELEIELNLLRGPDSTTAEVTTGLAAAEASTIRGGVVRAEISAHIARLTRTHPTLALELNDELTATRDALQDHLARTRAAIRSGRSEVGPNASTTVGAGEPLASSQRNDPSPGVDEQATAEARAALVVARRGADAIDAIVDAMASISSQLDLLTEDGGATDEATTARAIDEVHRLLQPLTEMPIATDTNDGASSEDRAGRSCVDPTASADFAQTLIAADQCVTGCAVGSTSPTCRPMSAKRLLLLGFQEQLETLTEDETITETSQALASRLAEVRADIAALDDPVAIHSLAMEGAGVILGDVVQALVLDDDRTARLGGWGWLVLAIGAIVGYRLLEVANDRRSPGPVAISAGEAIEGAEAKTQAATALVRSHLTAANLQEPSPLPGGEAVSSISASSEATGFENAVVRYVVNLLQTTAFPRRGVDLVVTAQPAESGLTPKQSADRNENGSPVEPYRLMVKATRKSRNGLVFSHPFTDQSLEEVTHAAAYFAAERLLDAGWTTPPWLVWSSQDGSALRAYQEVMIEKQSPRSVHGRPGGQAGSSGGDRVRTARGRLETAVRSSPGTGAALVALSHEAALEGDLVASVHYLLLARNRHDRFVTASYRLGVTLSMLASDLDSFVTWDRAKCALHPDSETENKRLAWENDWAGVNDLLDCPTGDGVAITSITRKALLLRSIEELSWVARSVHRPLILGRACRQAEREYWLSLYRSPRRRSGLRAAAESARALAARRLALLNGGSPDTLARRLRQCDEDHSKAVHHSRDDWLVRYNAACYEAARVERALAEDDSETAKGCAREAFDHLRRARFARNGQQLSIEWALADPDLVPLRRQVGDDDLWRRKLASVFQVDPDHVSSSRIWLRQLQDRADADLV